MTFATTHLPKNFYPIPLPTYQRITRSTTISHHTNKLGSTFRYSCLYCGVALVEPRSFPISLYRVSDRANFYFCPLYLYSLCETCSWEPWPSNAGLLNVFCWLWICGRREEHTVIAVSKNRCQLKTGGALLPAQDMARLPGLMLLLLSIIATAANKKPVLFRWPSVLAVAVSVRPLMVCKHCGNEARYHLEQGAAGNSSPFPCYFKISDIKFILTVLYFNRATINTQRIHADYLRLLACVICPRVRGLIVRRVICAWYIGRGE